MKTIDAKCPGVVTLITERHKDDYLARRDFVDTYNNMHITLYKDSMKTKEQIWNPVLYAGLLFFKELGIKGYKLEINLNRTIKTGLELLEDEMLSVSTIKAMNQLCDTRLSDEELLLLGSKLSPKASSLMRNETVIVNQNEEIIKDDMHSKDCFYNLILLNEAYNDLDLNEFFINENINIDENDPRYLELLKIMSIMKKNNAKNMSMNGNSKVIISSYQDIHDRFMAYRELKENHYSVSQLNRGNGMTMVKMYK